MTDKWLVFSDDDSEDEIKQEAQNQSDKDSNQEILASDGEKNQNHGHVALERPAPENDTISTGQSSVKSIKSSNNQTSSASTTISDPHVAQFARQMGREPPNYIVDFIDEDIRILHDDDERLPYRRRQKEAKTVAHDPFLAIILPLIEFLTEHAIYEQVRADQNGDSELSTSIHSISVVLNRPLWCVNAHLLLCALFPQVRFHVFEVFSKIGIENPGLYVYNFAITDAKFQKIKGDLCQKVIYANVQAENQQVSAKDPSAAFQHALEMQRLHVHQLRPQTALCYLQLPWERGETLFFAGKIFLPVYSGPTAAGVYLLVKPEAQGGNYKLQSFSHQKIEEQMFYFNTVRRVSRYISSLEFNFECFRKLDRCYDCTVYKYVLLKYLREVRKVDGSEKQLQMVWLLNQIEAARPVYNNNQRYNGVKGNKEQKRWLSNGEKASGQVD